MGERFSRNDSTPGGHATCAHAENNGRARCVAVLFRRVWGQAAQKKEAADRSDTFLRRTPAMLKDLRAARGAVLEAQSL